MGLLDRIFGTEPQHDGQGRLHGPGTDAYALERYRYMLQTAPPETIEQAHAEAFRKLTTEQRRQVLAELADAAPQNEKGGIESTSTDDPRAMARTATRAEIRQPGIMERTLGTAPGAGFGANLLGSFAAGFAGSMVANSFFSALGSGFAGFDGAGADAVDGADGDGVVLDADGAGADLDAGGDFDGADFDV